MSDKRHLVDFEGLWRLEREIDHDDGQRAVFRGTAVWSRKGPDLVCREQGTLEMAGHRMEAKRTTIWRAPLNVFFDDGAFFHSVPPCGGRAEHDCPPDRYTVAYDFDQWPHWMAEWRVDGPRKAYSMRSIYQR